MNNTKSEKQPKVYFIIGPTACGKSSLAFSVANKLNADILSADSRQVYKGLEITSGADIPADFTRVEDGTFINESGLTVYGQSLLHPTEVWSVGLFKEYVVSKIFSTFQKKKSLIIVGGAGLYLHALLMNDPHMFTGPNQQLRQKLAKLSLSELQTYISNLQPNAQNFFNDSDWKNPTRIIRGIEMIESNPKYQRTPIDEVENRIRFTTNGQEFAIEPVWFGILKDAEELQTSIEQRVKDRIAHGAITEIEKLIANYEDQKVPAFSTTGVKEVMLFINGSIDKEALIKQWTLREWKYAKRQLTWFKKRPYVNWQTLDRIKDAILKDS